MQKLDFKDIKVLITFKGRHKIEKQNSIDISASGYEKEQKHLIFTSKKCFEKKDADLSLIEVESKKEICSYQSF